MDPRRVHHESQGRGRSRGEEVGKLYSVSRKYRGTLS